MENIYFDNSATTRVMEEAAAAACRLMGEDFANPSSLHRQGALAARHLTEARQAMAAILKAEEEEIYFTSGGSEGNNTALLGAAFSYAKRGKKILVSAVEHPSVLEPAKALAAAGYQVELIPVDGWGKVDTAALAGLLTKDVIAVSVQQVNNETGSIQPLKEIGALIREKAPQALFHVDGVQAFVKIEASLKENGIDIYTASGHKVHAPKGVGFLWLKKGLRLRPLIYGGGQEKGLRSGTENMPGIAALKVAAQKLYQEREANYAQAAAVRAALIKGLRDNIPDHHFHTPLCESSPYILNASFPGCKSEVLLHYLEEEGLYVSSGSACHSRRDTRSHVLLAMGLSNELADSAIRYSFCAANTVAEAEKAALITARAVAEMRGLNNPGHRKDRPRTGA